MPLYEYQCTHCNEAFTLLQTVHVSPEETVCPGCGKGENKRLFSSFSAKTEGNLDLSGGTGSPGSHGCASGGCGCA